MLTIDNYLSFGITIYKDKNSPVLCTFLYKISLLRKGNNVVGILTIKCIRLKKSPSPYRVSKIYYNLKLTDLYGGVNSITAFMDFAIYVKP